MTANNDEIAMPLPRDNNEAASASQSSTSVPRMGGPDEAKTIDTPEFRERLRGMGAVIAVNGEHYKRFVGYINKYFSAHIAPQAAADTGAVDATAVDSILRAHWVRPSPELTKRLADDRAQQREAGRRDMHKTNVALVNENCALVERLRAATVLLATEQARASCADAILAAVPPAKAEGMSDERIDAATEAIFKESGYTISSERVRAILAQQAKGAQHD